MYEILEIEVRKNDYLFKFEVIDCIEIGICNDGGYGWNGGLY